MVEGSIANNFECRWSGWLWLATQRPLELSRRRAENWLDIEQTMAIVSTGRGCVLVYPLFLLVLLIA